MTTELVEDGAGVPRWFVADAVELREAIAGIPADVLREANDCAWLDRGLEPPERSIRDLRKELLEKHERTAERLPDELVLPVEEAARHLGLTGRVARYRVQQGHYADAERELRDGSLGIAFKPPAKRWGLVVDRPDPRVVLVMARDRVRPGESYEWAIAGSGRTQTYVRRSDGASWREVNHQ